MNTQAANIQIQDFLLINKPNEFGFAAQLGAQKHELPQPYHCRFPAPPNDYRLEQQFNKPYGDTTMRFMILVKATKDTEAGVTPKAGVAQPEKSERRRSITKGK